MPENTYILPGDLWETEREKYTPPGDLWEHERHILPQRMHDQEKGYSPGLKSLGGHSCTKPEGEKERQYTEQEKKEKCKLQKKLYDMLVDQFMKNQLKDQPTLEQVNTDIREMNEGFGTYGCPALPELEKRPMPTFAIKR